MKLPFKLSSLSESELDHLAERISAEKQLRRMESESESVQASKAPRLAFSEAKPLGYENAQLSASTATAGFQYKLSEAQARYLTNLSGMASPREVLVLTLTEGETDEFGYRSISMLTLKATFKANAFQIRLYPSQIHKLFNADTEDITMPKAPKTKKPTSQKAKKTSKPKKASETNDLLKLLGL